MSENRFMTVPADPGIVPHCETVLYNHDCPYIKRGCTGCLIKPLPTDDKWIKALSVLDVSGKRFVEGLNISEINSAVNRAAESMRMLSRQMSKLSAAWYASLPKETINLFKMNK